MPRKVDGFLYVLIFIAFAFLLRSQTAVGVTLFQNVRVLNNGQLSAPSNVLVKGNTIALMSTVPIPVDRNANTKIIEGSGRTLMPGLIDAHAHIMMESFPQSEGSVAEVGYLNLIAAKAANEMLLRGFTTIRDLGGPSFSLKKAIDGELIRGPRIYPSGAFISQTGGHGDFRLPPSYSARVGLAAFADSPDEVRVRAREQFMQGATQLKLMAGGGVTSAYDPIDATQYTETELRAAVEAAESWGTYVTAYAYTPRAIQAAIASGVQCIDHGQLADEASAKQMADKGIWWSLPPIQGDKVKGTDSAYKLARKYKIKTAWGTDTLFDAKAAKRQGAQLVKTTRWYTPAEGLKMATADNAALLAMSGPRNPYPGKLGVVEEGALADLLLVNGNPLENIKLIEDPEKYFVVIMKNGKIHKNSIH